jgi:hypothetical protein
MSNVKNIEFIVEAGTFVKMNGIPVEILQDTLMSCNPFNLTLALGLHEEKMTAPVQKKTEHVMYGASLEATDSAFKVQPWPNGYTYK